MNKAILLDNDPALAQPTERAVEDMLEEMRKLREEMFYDLTRWEREGLCMQLD